MLKTTTLPVICLIFVLACSVKKDHAVVLSDTLHSAENSIRWSMFLGFKELQSPEFKKHPLDSAFLDNIKVSEVSRLGMSMPEDQMTAEVHYQITFYEANAGVTKTLLHQQHWHFDNDKQRWFVDADLPDFAAALKTPPKPDNGPKIKVLELPDSVQ